MNAYVFQHFSILTGLLEASRHAPEDKNTIIFFPPQQSLGYSRFPNIVLLFYCKYKEDDCVPGPSHSVTGDELLSDSFPHKEIQNGILWEAEGKWVVKGAIEVNIGANPSEEGGDEEGVDDQPVKVVDIVDTFRLQEQPSFDKKLFMAHIKRYIKSHTANLPEDHQEKFEENVEGAVKWLLSKLDELQLCSILGLGIFKCACQVDEMISGMCLRS